MKYIETIKSIALVILFTLSVTLASIYIVNTQRLTMAGESPLDLDSLLFLRGEGVKVTELDASYLMPEVVSYSVGGDMRTVYADGLSAAEIYRSTHDMLASVLSGIDDAGVVADREAVIAECTSAESFVYLKYHAPLPAPLILTSITNEALSSQTAPIGESTKNVSEVFLILETVSANSTTYSAVVVCGDGRVLRCRQSEASVQYFQIDTLTAYNGTQSATVSDFAANLDSTASLSLSATSVTTDKMISAPLVAVDETIDGSSMLDESMLRAFEFNPDRINTYNESANVAVYVEDNVTLRVEPRQIRYTVSGDGGIEAARLLGYESYSGNYSIIELVGAAGSFIDSLRIASSGMIGGEAIPTLTSIRSEDGRLTLRYELTFDGATFYTDGFEPLVGYTLTFEGGRLKSADICTLHFRSGIGSVASYTQAWTLEKLAPRLSPMVRESVGRVEPGYIVTTPDDSSQATASFEWVYVYGDTSKEVEE